MAMEMSRSTERKEENEKGKKTKNTTQHHTSLKGVFPEQMPGTAATVCIFLREKGSSSVDGCVLLLPKLHPSAARQESCSRYVASRLHLGAAAL